MRAFLTYTHLRCALAVTLTLLLVCPTHTAAVVSLVITVVLRSMVLIVLSKKKKKRRQTLTPRWTRKPFVTVRSFPSKFAPLKKLTLWRESMDLMFQNLLRTSKKLFSGCTLHTLHRLRSKMVLLCRLVVRQRSSIFMPNATCKKVPLPKAKFRKLSTTLL